MRALLPMLLIVPNFALALEEECSIAVLDLQTQGLSEDQAHVPRILTDTIATEVSKRTECRVITQADITQMLDFEAQKAACDGEAVSCLAEVGDALGVGFVIGGSVGKLGATYTLQARYIDIGDAKVVRRVEVDVEGDVGKLRTGARSLAQQLVGLEVEAPVVAGGPSPVLLWTGAGLVVVGGALALVGTLASQGADSVLADPRASSSAKTEALQTGPAVFAGAVLGGLVLVGGGALVAMSFLAGE